MPAPRPQSFLKRLLNEAVKSDMKDTLIAYLFRRQLKALFANKSREIRKKSKGRHSRESRYPDVVPVNPGSGSGTGTGNQNRSGFRVALRLRGMTKKSNYDIITVPMICELKPANSYNYCV